MAEQVDILVIGAGFSGLGFTKFFLEIHPKTNLVIVDADTHVGGVWSSSRNYDSFWAQTGVSLSGFSDPPFILPDNITNKYDLYPASYLTEYLEKFCNHHVFNGRSLRERIRLQRHVTSAEEISHQSSHWRVTCRTNAGGSEVFHATKLVIATGHTSIPNYPSLPSRQRFSGPVVHHKEYASFVNKDDKAYYRAESPHQHIVVLGSGKSAADMAYDAVKFGKKKRVSWILRQNNSEGPPLFFPAADQVYGNSITRGSTRLAQLYSPSSFTSAYHPIVRLMNNTPWGRAHAAGKRDKGRDGCLAYPHYEDRPGALPGFEKLRPDGAHPFWYVGYLGLCQHDDFWDIISQNVHIYRADIKELGSNSVVLEDGTNIETDAVLCGTGWKSEYPFLSQKTRNALGLPHEVAQDSDEKRQLWDALLRDADSQVLSYFPILNDPPSDFRRSSSAVKMTTSRLYNLIAPLSDLDQGAGRSIVFLGHCDVSNSFRTAEAQGIWATAYLDGNLALPNLEAAQKETAWMNAFSRRRYPSKGHKGDCIFFETIWYTDRLMADLGITSHKDKLSWHDYFMRPNLAQDFKDVPAEYRRKFNIA